MTQETREQQIERGDQASRLNEYPAFQTAVNATISHYTNLWANSEPADEETRSEAYYALRVVNQITNQINQFVIDGDKAIRIMSQTKETIHGR